MKAVEKLVAAVRAERFRESLELALPLWRSSRDPALGKLIIAIGQQVDQTVKPLTGAKADVVKKQLAWAKKKDPATLGRLLEPNPIGNWADRHRLMEALAQWPADPRVGHHALMLAKSFPRDHLTMPSYFPPLFDVLVRHADSAVADAAKDKRSNLTREEAKELKESLKQLVPLDAASRKHIDGVLKSLEAPAGGADEDTLLQAIYARPDDDAARAVYADALSARGDPRGEFIILQLAPKPTAEQRERMRALLAKHEKTWSGPLALVLEKRKYERGFLVAGEVGYSTEEEQEFHPDAPEWKTVERLTRATREIGAQFTRLVELQTRDPMVGLFPRLQTLEVDDLAQVAKAELPKLTSLEVWKANKAQLKAFLERPASKNLTSLSVHGGDAAGMKLPAGLQRLGGSEHASLVRDGDGWRLELRAAGGDFRRLGEELAPYENQPISTITFAGSWNRFGPRNLADCVGPKLRTLINSTIDQSRGKFMK